MNINGQLPLPNETSQAIALSACSYILGEDSLRDRFLALSGLSSDEIRLNIENTDFLVHFLEFLVMHEPDLIAFAEQASITPETAVKAWRSLGGGKGQEW